MHLTLTPAIPNTTSLIISIDADWAAGHEPLARERTRAQTLHLLTLNSRELISVCVTLGAQRSDQVHGSGRMLVGSIEVSAKLCATVRFMPPSLGPFYDFPSSFHASILRGISLEPVVAYSRTLRGSRLSPLRK